jgi:hypothetical protein
MESEKPSNSVFLMMKVWHEEPGAMATFSTTGKNPDSKSEDNLVNQE